MKREPITFGEGLFLLFVGLKLSGHVDWSWWYVSLPLTIGIAIAFVVATVAAVITQAKSR